jgi:hypothetical protein
VLLGYHWHDEHLSLAGNITKDCGLALLTESIGKTEC